MTLVGYVVFLLILSNAIALFKISDLKETIINLKRENRQLKNKIILKEWL